MDRQNFEVKDRFPLSTQALTFMQDMILASAQLALIGGDNYILSGCEATDNNVAPGIIVINGEIMPFEGGTSIPTITVVETYESVSANGLTFEKARVSRKARFATGSGPNYYAWADFKPLQTNKQLEEVKATIQYVDNEIAKIQSGSIPTGVIVMWSGSEAEIPTGWALCDGHEYKPGKFTPNLSGKFVVGFNRQDTDYDKTGKTGGMKEVTLTTGQLPEHIHKVDDYFRFDDPKQLSGIADGSVSFAASSEIRNDGQPSNTMYYKTHDTKATGGNESHENRPPYYVLAFIIKIDTQN